MEMIGHVLRKEPDDTTKIALYWTPEGKRKRGRPKVTWRRTVEAELKDMKESWNSLQKQETDTGGIEWLLPYTSKA
jgi:hypothetical protein